MRKFVFVSIIFGVLSSYQIWAANERKPITIRSNSTNTTFLKRPHAPERPMVEAWLDGEVLTIEFIAPLGEATLSLSSSMTELESVSFSTDVPFVIDLTPYPEAESFTIETETGHSYIGYFY